MKDFEIYLDTEKRGELYPVYLRDLIAYILHFTNFVSRITSLKQNLRVCVCLLPLSHHSPTSVPSDTRRLTTPPCRRILQSSRGAVVLTSYPASSLSVQTLSHLLNTVLIIPSTADSQSFTSCKLEVWALFVASFLVHIGRPRSFACDRQFLNSAFRCFVSSHSSNNRTTCSPNRHMSFGIPQV